MGNKRRMPRWAALLAALWAGLATAACGGDRDPGEEEPAGTATTSESTDTTVAESTTTTLSPEEEVEAAVMAYEAMASRLIQAPDPNDPEIALRATGQNRSHLEAQMQELVTLGHAGQLGPNTSQTVLHTQVSGDRATVEMCSVDDGVLVELATGRVLNDDVVTDHSIVTLERIDGSWLVAQRTRIEKWEGVTDCA